MDTNKSKEFRDVTPCEGVGVETEWQQRLGAVRDVTPCEGVGVEIAYM